jgi:NlpC/P60 family putative phage cell wall peptidase
MRGDAIAAAARHWLGTPYRHQGRCKGAGADCLGLVLGVWEEVVGMLPEIPPPYSADWGESRPNEILWQAAARHLTPVADGAARPGDILLFRMRPRAIAKHLGIQSGCGAEERFIHAYSGQGVVETGLSGVWAQCLAARFRIPEGV